MPNESSPSRDSRLERVIAEYLQQLEAGHAPSQDDLLQAHPDLAASLKAFFADHRRMRDLAARPGLAQDDATLPPSSLPADSGNADDDATISPTRRADAPAVGTRVRYFGDYELLEEIARGGMGVVYKARQTKLNRIVALKMILSGQLAGEEDIRRFHAEAEAAAQLDHPGIVPIFEVGEHEGQHYFSMAFVDGGSLADKIKDGPLPPREAAEYVKKVAEAVAYAHSKGVIHRDLKPGNILLDLNGEPKVTDFGLAKRVEGDSGLTATGQILGTPSYMPPEQASGKTEDVKEAADVYSLGAILYALVTGRPPFQADNPIDTLMQVLEREPVSPSTLNPQIPRDLETICLQCLSKEPKKRFRSAKQLGDELQRFINGEPILARPIGKLERTWRWCRRQPVVASLIATVAISLLVGSTVSTFFGIASRQAAILATENEREAITAKNQMESERDRANRANRQLEAANDQLQAALAHSNYLLALARWNENRVSEAITYLQAIPEDRRRFEWYLARNQFRGGYATYGNGASAITSVALSSDGTQVFTGNALGELMVRDAESGAELNHWKVGEGAVTRVALSPDGSRVLSRVGTILRLSDARSGAELATLEGFAAGFQPALSQDHARIAGSVLMDELRNLDPQAFVRQLQALQGRTNIIALWDASTGQQIASLEGYRVPTAGASVALRFDGKCLAVGGADGTVKLWEVASDEEMTQINPQRGPISRVAFSPDGVHLAVGFHDGLVRLYDVDTRKEIVVLSGHADDVDTLVFRPDGQRLVSGNGQGLCFWDVTNGDQLASYKVSAGYRPLVKFSPDGSQLVAGSYHGDIRVWRTDNGQALATLRGHLKDVRDVAFSADGKRFVSGSDDGTAKLWRITPGAETASLHLDEFEQENLNCLAVGGQENALVIGSSDGKLVLLDPVTKEVLQLSSGHAGCLRSVTFNPDGTLVAIGCGHAFQGTVGRHSDGTRFRKPDPGSPPESGVIKLLDARTLETVREFTGHTSPVSNVRFSPDGTKLLSSSSDRTLRMWHVQTGSLLYTTELVTSAVSAAFSADGLWVATGNLDGTIQIWEAETGTEAKSLSGHRDPGDDGQQRRPRGVYINSILFHPTGSTLVTAGVDGSIRQWDIETGEEIARLVGHAGSVHSIAMTADGDRLASGGSDNTVRLWDLKSGAELQALTSHNAVVRSVEFNAAGTQLISASHDNVIKFWDAPHGQRVRFDERE